MKPIFSVTNIPKFLKNTLRSTQLFIQAKKVLFSCCTFKKIYYGLKLDYLNSIF